MSHCNFALNILLCECVFAMVMRKWWKFKTNCS